MKVVIETSVLVSGSVFWRHKDEETGEVIEISDPHLTVCTALFEILRKLRASRICIVTETTENEARNALYWAIGNVISQMRFSSLEMRYKIMKLQHIVNMKCLDQMDLIIDKTSVRMSVGRYYDKVWIVDRELKPFFRTVVATTFRYVQPDIPSLVKDPNLRNELTDIMIKTIPARGPIFKGLPEPKDLTTMAEATILYRRYFHKREKVYVASRDNHFIPNPVQVGSYLTGRKKHSGELDSTVRDWVAAKFGFIGEHPAKIIELLKTTYQRELATA